VIPALTIGFPTNDLVSLYELNVVGRNISFAYARRKHLIRSSLVCSVESFYISQECEPITLIGEPFAHRLRERYQKQANAIPVDSADRCSRCSVNNDMTTCSTPTHDATKHASWGGFQKVLHRMNNNNRSIHTRKADGKYGDCKSTFLVRNKNTIIEAIFHTLLFHQQLC
jgi:hypothetical protein